MKTLKIKLLFAFLFFTLMGFSQTPFAKGIRLPNATENANAQRVPVMGSDGIISKYIDISTMLGDVETDNIYRAYELTVDDFTLAEIAQKINGLPSFTIGSEDIVVFSATKNSGSLQGSATVMLRDVGKGNYGVGGLDLIGANITIISRSSVTDVWRDITGNTPEHRYDETIRHEGDMVLDNDIYIAGTIRSEAGLVGGKLKIAGNFGADFIGGDPNESLYRFNMGSINAKYQGGTFGNVEIGRAFFPISGSNNLSLTSLNINPNVNFSNVGGAGRTYTGIHINPNITTFGDKTYAILSEVGDAIFNNGKLKLGSYGTGNTINGTAISNLGVDADGNVIPTDLAEVSTTDYISNVAVNGNDIDFTALGNAFGGTITLPTSEGLPEGGADGEVLIKNSSTDYDATWGRLSDGYVPITGTELGKPITGDLVLDNSSSGLAIKGNSSNSQLVFATDGSIEINKNGGGKVYLSTFLFNGGTVERGITGAYDYSQNIGALDYTQKIYVDTKEPALGNPSTNGQVLSSTTDGTRSWIDVTGGSGGGGTTDYISNVNIDGNDLRFYGVGNAFVGTVTLPTSGGGGGTSGQDNIDRVLTLEVDNFSKAEIAHKLNTGVTVTVAENEILYISAVNLSGEEQGKVVAKLKNTSKGTYGSGGIVLTANDIHIISSSGVTIDIIDGDSNTQTISLGDIGSMSVEDAFNGHNFGGVKIQSQSSGYVLVNTVQFGATNQYLFVGLGGYYGVSPPTTALIATSGDFSLFGDNYTNGLWSIADGGGENTNIPATGYTQNMIHGGDIIVDEGGVMVKSIKAPTAETYAVVVDDTGKLASQPPSGGGSGGINSVVAGTNITVNATDPLNPIVNAVVEDIITDPETQFIDLGDTGIQEISSSFNAHTFTGTESPVQDYDEGHIIVNTISHGTPVQYLFIGDGGDYGVGGTLTATHSQFILLTDILSDPTTQFITLGEIGQDEIFEAFNAQNPCVTVQAQENGYVITNVTIDGVALQYFFVGDGGSYGSGCTQSVSEDFVEFQPYVSPTAPNQVWTIADSHFNNTGVPANLNVGNVRHEGIISAHGLRIPADRYTTSKGISTIGYGWLPISGNYGVKFRGGNGNHSNFQFLINSPTVVGNNETDYGIITKRTYAAPTTSNNYTALGIDVKDLVNLSKQTNSKYAAFRASPIITGVVGSNKYYSLYSALPTLDLLNAGDVIFPKIKAPTTETYAVVIDDEGTLSSQAISGGSGTDLELYKETGTIAGGDGTAIIGDIDMMNEAGNGFAYFVDASEGQAPTPMSAIVLKGSMVSLMSGDDYDTATGIQIDGGSFDGNTVVDIGAGNAHIGVLGERNEFDGAEIELYADRINMEASNSSVNVSENNINFGIGSYTYLKLKENELSGQFNKAIFTNITNGGNFTLDNSNITTQKTQTYQNKSGTIALLSDITGGGGSTPLEVYSESGTLAGGDAVATIGDLDISDYQNTIGSGILYEQEFDELTLKANNITIGDLIPGIPKGSGIYYSTDGAQFNSIDISARTLSLTGDGYLSFESGTGKSRFLNGNSSNFVDLNFSNITGGRQQSVQDKDGTFAYMDDIENLGNPTVNGQVLSSTTTGVRSWVTPSGGGGSGGLSEYTVATLPVGVEGDTAYVTDATNPTYLGALTGGGTVKCPVFYNGISWVSH